jgi:hypothetical protein
LSESCSISRITFPASEVARPGFKDEQWIGTLSTNIGDDSATSSTNIDDDSATSSTNIGEE